jgi:hypothetical protein
MHAWTRPLHDRHWRLRSLIDDCLRTENHCEGLRVSLKTIAFVLLPRHAQVQPRHALCLQQWRCRRQRVLSSLKAYSIHEIVA